jgi:hypothetical protein
MVDEQLLPRDFKSDALPTGAEKPVDMLDTPAATQVIETANRQTEQQAPMLASITVKLACRLCPMGCTSGSGHSMADGRHGV